MRTLKRSDGWWIEDVPAYRADGEEFTSCGPYGTRAEADDDRQGLEKFYKRNPRFLAEACAGVVSGTAGEPRRPQF